MSLNPGDCILLSTDGLIEAKNDEGEQFGWERIENCLTRETRMSSPLNPAYLLPCLGLLGECPQADDITLVLAGFEEK